MEALLRHDFAAAGNMLHGELFIYRTIAPKVYEALIELMGLPEMAEHKYITGITDNPTVENLRAHLVVRLKEMLEKEPALHLTFPEIPSARLRTIINQGLSWQHKDCANKTPVPIVRTLFYDHKCESGPQSPLPNGDAHASEKKRASQESTEHSDSDAKRSKIDSDALEQSQNSNKNPPIPHNLPPPKVPSPVASMAPVAPPSASTSSTSTSSTSPSTPSASTPAPAPSTPLPTSPSTSSPTPSSTSTSSQPASQLPPPTSLSPTNIQAQKVSDLPVNKKHTFNLLSNPVSIAFHPHNPNLLLVGSSDGLISVCFISQQPYSTSILRSEKRISIAKVSWSYFGDYFAVAFMNGTLAIYTYDHKQREIKLHIEIPLAHSSHINDIAFALVENRQFVVSCAKDASIHVFDINTATLVFNLAGHTDEVLNLVFNESEVPILFSVSKDSTVKAWLFDNEGPQAEFSATHKWYTCIAMSDDRLFACGAGPQTLVEINQGEGNISKVYEQFTNAEERPVRMRMSDKGWFAVPDGENIKFWNVDQLQPIQVCQPRSQRVADISLNALGDTLVVFFEDSPLIDIYGPGVASSTPVSGGQTVSTSVPAQSAAQPMEIDSPPRVTSRATSHPQSTTPHPQSTSHQTASQPSSPPQSATSPLPTQPTHSSQQRPAQSTKPPAQIPSPPPPVAQAAQPILPVPPIQPHQPAHHAQPEQPSRSTQPPQTPQIPASQPPQPPTRSSIQPTSPTPPLAQPVSHTQASTQPPPSTQSPTQTPTQTPSQASTQPPTQSPTRTSTQTPTQPPTQPLTQPPTPSPPTQTPTQAPTQPPLSPLSFFQSPAKKIKISASLLPQAHDNCPVHCIRYFNNTKSVISVGRTDGQIILFKCPPSFQTSARITQSLFDNPQTLSPCIDVSRNNSYVIVSGGPLLNLYKTKTQEMIREFWNVQKVYMDFMEKNPQSNASLQDFIPSAVAYKPEDNNYFAVGFQKGAVRVLSVKKEPPFLYEGHTNQIYTLEFTDKYLVSASGDGHVHFIAIPPPGSEVPSGTTRIQKISDPMPTKAYFAPHSSFSLLLVVQPACLITYECKYTGDNVEMIQKSWYPSMDPIVSACFTSDGKYIICCKRSSVEIFQYQSELTSVANIMDLKLGTLLGRAITSFSALATPPKSLSADGTYECCIGAEDGTLFELEIRE
eukprot:Phypoly_transcript_00967.p1 GENE.Phypoly_transcript_00967~~Phypoly_transcript_00967.p1  ORF type:complete len:1276 (+),score=267.39 Phypoly_transcript_00967:293-3829(+)